MKFRGDGWFGDRKVLRAVDGVSFDLERSETLGIVGESGCGKSTLARAVLGLVRVTSGEVRFVGQDLARLGHEKLREQRQHLQIIFQDPLSSLDPRMNVGQIIAEPLRSFFPRMTQEERQAKVVEMMRHVGLLPEQINRYPHEFSGGQAQRIGIARALISAAGSRRLRRACFGAGRFHQGANRKFAGGPASQVGTVAACSSRTIWLRCATSAVA